MPTAEDFRRGARRELGLLFADRELSVNEAARMAGTRASAIYGLVQRMHSEGLLTADSDPDPPTRGTSYKLSESAREALEEAVDGHEPLGLLAERQWLIVAEGRRTSVEVQRLFEQRGLIGNVAWIARLDGSHGLLLAMSPHVDEREVQRLTMALEKLGLTAIHHEVGAVHPGRKLSEDAITALDQVEHLM